MRATGSPRHDDQTTTLHRDLIIAAAVVKMGLTQQEVGDVFRLTQQRVSCIVQKMERLAGPHDMAD